MIRRLLSLLIGALFAAPLFAQSTDVSPDTLVKNVAEDTMAIVRSDQNIRTSNHKIIVDLVEAKVLPHFDFDRMTRLAMGNNWGHANFQQQQVLIGEFRTLLIDTYASAFMRYKNQTIAIKPLRLQPSDTDVVVRTQVNQQNGQPPVAVDYRMEKLANGWKVYDFNIEGVDWVLNYRNTFNNDIQNSGVDGLIKALQDKNKSLAQAQGSGKTNFIL